MKSLLFVGVLLLSQIAYSAVLIEESGKPVAPQSGSSVQDSAPTSNKIWIQTPVEKLSAMSSLDLRSKRRVGVGVTAAGPMGLYGTELELNFLPETSFLAGFGGGPGYQSFEFQWKRSFGGTHFSPFVSFGYSRWYNSAAREGGIKSTTPSLLTSKFLSNEERASGSFGVDLFTPSVGIQYYQLDGDYIGLSLYAEVVMLVAVDQMMPAPTGGLGLLYYF